MKDTVKILADIIEERAAKKKNYGVFLIPEGVIEFFPDLGKLIEEINTFFGLTKLDEQQAKA